MQVYLWQWQEGPSSASVAVIMNVEAVPVFIISCFIITSCVSLENNVESHRNETIPQENRTHLEQDRRMLVEDKEHGPLTSNSTVNEDSQVTLKVLDNVRNFTKEGSTEEIVFDQTTIKPKEKKSSRKYIVKKKRRVIFTNLNSSEQIQKTIPYINIHSRRSFDVNEHENAKEHKQFVSSRKSSPMIGEDMERIAFQQDLKNDLFLLEQENPKTIQKRTFNLRSLFGMEKKEPRTVVTIVEEVPVPVPYTVEKNVPVPVKVEVERPIPVEVSKPYPVPVEKKVYYPVKEYVHAPYPVYKDIPYMVKILVDNPIPVHVTKPYPVYIHKNVPYPVEKQIPIAVRIPVERPYPVPMPVMRNLYYPVEKRVPFPVPVPVEKPYPVYIEQHVPVEVEHTDHSSVPVPVGEETGEEFGNASFHDSGNTNNDFGSFQEQSSDIDSRFLVNELRKADNDVVKETTDPTPEETLERHLLKNNDQAIVSNERTKTEEVSTSTSQLPESQEVEKEATEHGHEFGKKIRTS